MTTDQGIITQYGDRARDDDRSRDNNTAGGQSKG